MLVLHNDPFPHIIVKDFIRDEETLDFLCNNKELLTRFDESGFGNLERIEIYGESEMKGKGKFTFNLPNDCFSEKFNQIVSNFLISLKNDADFHWMVRDTFTPLFEKEYPNFKESFEPKLFSYGGYNKCVEAKNLIGWHLDRGDKLLAGFIYLREDGDTSDDGHLYLSNGEDDYEKKITYENNVFVMWPNFINAWHRAGVRFPTKHARRIVNMVYKTDSKYYHDYTTPRIKNIVDVNELYPHKEFGFKEVRKL